VEKAAQIDEIQKKIQERHAKSRQKERDFGI
jgi:hypothetical protein